MQVRREKQKDFWIQILDQLKAKGPQSARELCASLNVSQSTFSRFVSKSLSAELLRVGKGPQTRYACRKADAPDKWGKSEIPILCLDDKGTLSLVAFLYPLWPKGFYLESKCHFLTSRFYDDFPYLFEDMHPSGFLGRLIPRLYPQLHFNPDISHWNDDDRLTYLCRCGWDLIGNFIIGEEAEESYRINYIECTDQFESDRREFHYPKLAQMVLSQGVPGSSAGGEQAKFLAVCRTNENMTHVMVKFSPPISSLLGRRVADLMICEHIAHEVLRQNGKMAATSRLFMAEGRLFLEIDRFDRTNLGGRLGLISLRALDYEFVGKLNNWSETAKILFQKKIITQEMYQDIIWFEVFGKLIGNCDRHLGNLSFYCHGEQILGLSPIYDMLPMVYSPQQNQLLDKPFVPELPKFYELEIWSQVVAVAQQFWQAVQDNNQISEDFKRLVADNYRVILNKI